jgi:hypothetical protein
MRAFVMLLAIGVLACRSSTPQRFSCDRSVPGLDAHLARGKLLWFGEMHGTAESPRFVVDAACHAARLGRVQLGLEVPGAEQARIDAFLRSDGSPAARTALLAGPFWDVRDGRSSEAMFDLVDRTRRLRASGATIDIVAFDGPARDRDAAMADVVAKTRDPEAIFIGLSGNVHSRRTKGTSWDPEYVALVAHLVARGLPITTWNVSANGGSFWGCVSKGPDDEPTCGEHPNSGSETGDPWTLGPARDESHDGVYRVGPTTASPPARP